MTLADALQIYGAALTTLCILAASLRYIISSRIKPIETKLEGAEEKISDLKEEIKSLEEEIDNLKQALVNDIKEISQGNFEFRLKYEGAIKDLRLLLAEKYASKEELEKEVCEFKKSIGLHQELKSIRRHIEDIKKEGKK
jgi:predicted RNase H-like nuclease (RuvC/YqgF family)